MIFQGSFVALITPFRDGKVDEDAVRKMVQWHIGQGTDGLVPMGTTGESATLDFKEHSRVTEIVVEEDVEVIVEEEAASDEAETPKN